MLTWIIASYSYSMTFQRIEPDIPPFIIFHTYINQLLQALTRCRQSRTSAAPSTPASFSVFPPTAIPLGHAPTTVTLHCVSRRLHSRVVALFLRSTVFDGLQLDNGSTHRPNVTKKVKVAHSRLPSVGFRS